MIHTTFVILFKVNIDINFTAVLLKIMFCIIIVHMIAILMSFNLTTSTLIEVTSVDDDYNESRIQCVCLLDTNGKGNDGSGTIKFDRIIDLTSCIFTSIFNIEAIGTVVTLVQYIVKQRQI